MWRLEAFVADRHTHDEVGVRLFAEHMEEGAAPSSTPSLVKTFIHRHKLLDAGFALSEQPVYIETDDKYEAFLSLLRAPDRRLPIVAISQRRTGSPHYLLDPERAARALQGFAHVVALPSARSFRLTDDLGRKRSVFHGAVRTYMPGFTNDGDRGNHHLYLAERVTTASSAGRPFEDVLAARLRRASVDISGGGRDWPDARESVCPPVSLVERLREKAARIFARRR
ncbi:hypothetical protein G3O01_11110 [Burkholderia sp. Ac-20365]|nr:hypothetical protein [Burkholderia sp. Ac-20365]